MNKKTKNAAPPMTNAKTLNKQLRRALRERELAEAIVKTERGLAVENRRFAVILADPPWRWQPYSRVTGMDRAADNHYPTLPLDRIKALVPPAHRDAVLFLWAISSMLPQALEVMAAWGFRYKTSAVWVKPSIGTGYWFRSRHEHLLVGTRGRIPAPAMGTQWSSVIEAPTRGHSVKPDTVYKLIESYFPTLQRLEMFARTDRPGWTAWGAEAPEAVKLETVIREAATFAAIAFPSPVRLGQ
jgi:N6-adenosine-specific RNA methylase IME4